MPLCRPAKSTASFVVVTETRQFDSADFLQNFWQKKPLILRGCFAEFRELISPDELAGLACEEQVASRLVTGSTESIRWTAADGPFAETEFEKLGENDWTLLVQDLEKWLPTVFDSFMAWFDFIPRWRIDDVMASFAAPGGSVGPHVDQYDVFLVQTDGSRLWQLSEQKNFVAQANQPLSLLANFDSQFEAVLEPGDALYLPPNLAHHGVAQSACVTLSLGMRAPSAAELLNALLADELERGDHSPRLTDPLGKTLAPNVTTSHAAGAESSLNQYVKQLTSIDSQWLAQFLSTYRLSDFAQSERGSDHQVSGTVRPDPFSRFVPYHGPGQDIQLFANGQQITASGNLTTALTTGECIDSSSLNSKDMSTLQDLFTQGLVVSDD